MMRNDEHVHVVVDAPDGTTTTSSIECAQNVQTIELPVEALVKMHELADAPPPPSARLREAARRYGR
jgi:uncharacterized protein (DUF1778 family)